MHPKSCGYIQCTIFLKKGNILTTSENQPDRIHQLEQQVEDYELLFKALECISSASSVEDAIQHGALLSARRLSRV